MSKKDKEKNTTRDLSAANLSAEFIIKDPRDYIKEIRKTFLRKAREAKKLSLKDVANKLNVSPADLKAMEEGNINEKHLMLLHELSDLYDIDYHRLLYLYKLATITANRAN